MSRRVGDGAMDAACESVPSQLSDYLDTTEQSAITMDGFDEAIVGFVNNPGESPRVVYDYQRCIQVLCTDMEEGEAIEHFDFNCLGSMYPPSSEDRLWPPLVLYSLESRRPK